ncbi:hypothetical protein GE107_20780 [Cohnella sp. CFH 77786]|uniref:hypothetical protein n=1 Tax=Cohnella sp. CFH 77786 TaxID=2662265 RepID=UPI001C60F721|nr:hypothetical protein [Cohnella sp. CFH 77786]MBW5448484.1 hypothetical protein [Cohnella sp. CFH 77786]
MIPDLLWIIGFYVAAAAMAHGVIGRGADARKRHYVLVAGNHQMEIEGYVRALQTFSRRTGTDIGITVVLENSSDDTGPILERFAKVSDAIGWIRSGPDEAQETRERMMKRLETQGAAAAPQQVVWVELGKREDLSRLPL